MWSEGVERCGVLCLGLDQGEEKRGGIERGWEGEGRGKSQCHAVMEYGMYGLYGLFIYFFNIAGCCHCGCGCAHAYRQYTTVYYTVCTVDSMVGTVSV
jgi:hypothetical protein